MWLRTQSRGKKENNKSPFNPMDRLNSEIKNIQSLQSSHMNKNENCYSAHCKCHQLISQTTGILIGNGYLKKNTQTETKLDSMQKKQQEKEQRKKKISLKQMAKSRRGKEQKQRGRLYATTGERSNDFSAGPEMTVNKSRETPAAIRQALQTQGNRRSQGEHAS